MSFLRTCLFISTLIILFPVGMIGDNIDPIKTTSNTFQGHSDAMEIDGAINIVESIELSLSISPTDQGMMHQDMMSEYHNEMRVSISELVEFEDLSNDGLSDGDLILSRYTLNQVNLDQAEVQTVDGITSFLIQSKETNIFRMNVEVNKYGEMPVAFKWSYEVNYPFISNRTDLAILHSLEENTQTMMDLMNNNHMNPTFEGLMSDNHKNLPMVFAWDDSAVIDDVETDIHSRVLDDDFVLSFPHGNKILYDPLIRLDPSDISEIDDILSGLSLEFLKPQERSILFGFIGISIIFTTGLILDRRTRVRT